LPLDGACGTLCAMGHPAEQRQRATYADYAAVPSHQLAELIDGTLYVFPRPAPPHTQAASDLGGLLAGPFRFGIGGPGGWRILDEPELQLVHEEPMVPDLAGWRLERMPELPKTAYFALPPDWICEILSPSTEEHDRETKMPIYAAHGVRHAWLIDPIARVLEAYDLDGRRWSAPAFYRGDVRARLAPFEAVELDLSILWAR
jgi:Uma2 family endonuclease